MKSGSILLGALIVCFACSRGGNGVGGTSPTYLTQDGGDGGTATGHPDSGNRPDSGPITFPDSGPVVIGVSAVAPDRGPTAGGTPVTITGNGFLSGLAPSDPIAGALVTQVSFGGNPVLQVTILSDAELAVTTPAGTVGAADVVVENPNGNGTCAGCYDYLSPIELDSVTPAQGPAGGGTAITVRGLGFDQHTTLLVGSRATIATQLVSSTQLTALTPPASLPGAATVRAFNGNGVASLYGAFTYVATPTIAALAPVFGPLAGGTAVTLTGSGFLGLSVSVSLGGVPASAATVLDDATVTFVTPPASAPGPVSVAVSDANGAATLAGAFVYVDETQSAFGLLAVVPASGPSAGGNAATLVGSGFPAGPFEAIFGAAGTAATPSSPNAALLAVPAGTPGAVTVTADAGGTLAALVGGYLYTDRSVTSVSPSAGPSDGGTSIQITGVGFLAGDTVLVGPLPATAVNVVSPTQIDAVTPAGSAGPVDVTVAEGDGGDPVTLADGFTYVDPFSLVQVTPASGAQAGGTYVQLLGTGFGLGDSASFGLASATDLELLDGYTLACHTPPGTPGPVDVSATGPGDAGTSTLPGGFSYFDPRNSAGGQTGGPLDGTLNVTVLSSYGGSFDQPVQGATVRLGLDPQTPFQGMTDANGQITFSDPTLVKAQTVTVIAGALASTIDDVTQQNLTVFLDLGVGGGGGLPPTCPCSKDGEPPNCPDNCGLPYCSLLGICVQCLSDSDCTNPSTPGYDPQKPHCNPPGGFGGACVTCISNGDCADNPNGDLACDNIRGFESTYTCVQCTSNSFCAGSSGAYCNLSTETCVAPDLIEGTVYGFKIPSTLTLSATQHPECRVGLLQPSIEYFEPFEPDPPEFVITPTVSAESGAFGFQLDANALTVAVYAKFGIADTSDGSFTPLYLGVARGVSVSPTAPVTNLIVTLDTHLDQVAPLQLQNTIAPPPQVFFLDGGEVGGDTNAVLYDTYAYLDLGQDGVLPLSDVTSSTAAATLGGLPPLQGNGIIFLTQAFQNPPTPQVFADPSQRSPVSDFFDQISGDFTQGVTVGPLLPFALPLQPASGGNVTGTFQWSFGGSTPPLTTPPDLAVINLAYVQVGNDGIETSPTDLWQIVVPGSETEVQIPPDALTALLATVPPSSPTDTTFLFWTLSTANTLRFDFSFFSYADLSEGQWTSFQTTQVLAVP